MCFSPEGYSLIEAIWVCAAPSGRVFALFWSEKRVYTLLTSGLESVMVYEGTAVVDRCVRRFRIPTE